MAGNRIEYTIGFKTDTSSLDKLKKSLDGINKLSSRDLMNFNNTGLSLARRDLLEINANAKKVQNAMSLAFNPKLGTASIDKFNMALKNSDTSLLSVVNSFGKAGSAGVQGFNAMLNGLVNTDRLIKKTNQGVQLLINGLALTMQWTILHSAVNEILGTVKEAYGYVKNLDTSLNDIQIVTGKSADEMERYAQTALKAAKELSVGTNSYVKSSLTFYQQGLSDKDVKARTDVTTKAANVTGQSASAVADQLTAVWNGYKVSAEEAEVYVDRLAAVAAHSASNLQELSTGMSKVASAANTMGVSEEQLASQLSTVISVTRESAETIGTSFKTIYARMSDIKAGIDEEGVSLGNYTSKIAAFGINVLDGQDNIRDMGEVIEEVGEKWNGFSREQQLALTQAMAGTRQYSRLLALFDNWDKYKESLETARDAQGELQRQQDTYAESVEAHLQLMKTAEEGVFDSLIDTKEINSGVDALTSLFELVEKLVDGAGGLKGVFMSFGPALLSIFNKNVSDTIAKTVTNIRLLGKEALLARNNISSTTLIGMANNNSTASPSLKNILAMSVSMTKTQSIEASLGMSKEELDSLTTSNNALLTAMILTLEAEERVGAATNILTEQMGQLKGLNSYDGIELLKESINNLDEEITSTNILKFEEDLLKLTTDGQVAPLFKNDIDNVKNFETELARLRQEEQQLQEEQDRLNNGWADDANASLQIEYENMANEAWEKELSLGQSIRNTREQRNLLLQEEINLKDEIKLKTIDLQQAEERRNKIVAMNDYSKAANEYAEKSNKKISVEAEKERYYLSIQKDKNNEYSVIDKSGLRVKASESDIIKLLDLYDKAINKADQAFNNASKNLNAAEANMSKFGATIEEVASYLGNLSLVLTKATNEVNRQLRELNNLNAALVENGNKQENVTNKLKELDLELRQVNQNMRSALAGAEELQESQRGLNQSRSNNAALLQANRNSLAIIEAQRDDSLNNINENLALVKGNNNSGLSISALIFNISDDQIAKTAAYNHELAILSDTSDKLSGQMAGKLSLSFLSTTQGISQLAMSTSNLLSQFKNWDNLDFAGKLSAISMAAMSLGSSLNLIDKGAKAYQAFKAYAEQSAMVLNQYLKIQSELNNVLGTHTDLMNKDLSAQQAAALSLVGINKAKTVGNGLLEIENKMSLNNNKIAKLNLMLNENASMSEEKRIAIKEKIKTLESDNIDLEMARTAVIGESTVALEAENVAEGEGAVASGAKSVANGAEAITEKTKQVAIWDTIKALIAEKLATLAAIAPLALAAAAIGAIAYAVYKFATADEEAAKQALKNLERYLKNLDEAKSRVDTLISSIENIKNSSDALDELTTGTEEWYELLLKCNDEVLKLLETFPELAQYLTTDENGQYIIDEEGLEKVKELAKKLQARAEEATFEGLAEKAKADYKVNVKKAVNFEGADNDKDDALSILIKENSRTLAEALETLNMGLLESLNSNGTFSEKDLKDIMSNKNSILLLIEEWKKAENYDRLTILKELLTKGVENAKFISSILNDKGIVNTGIANGKGGENDISWGAKFNFLIQDLALKFSDFVKDNNSAGTFDKNKTSFELTDLQTSELYANLMGISMDKVERDKHGFGGTYNGEKISENDILKEIEKFYEIWLKTNGIAVEEAQKSVLQVQLKSNNNYDKVMQGAADIGQMTESELQNAKEVALELSSLDIGSMSKEDKVTVLKAMGIDTEGMDENALDAYNTWISAWIDAVKKLPPGEEIKNNLESNNIKANKLNIDLELVLNPIVSKASEVNDSLGRDVGLLLDNIFESYEYEEDTLNEITALLSDLDGTYSSMSEDEFLDRLEKEELLTEENSAAWRLYYNDMVAVELQQNKVGASTELLILAYQKSKDIKSGDVISKNDYEALPQFILEKFSETATGKFRYNGEKSIENYLNEANAEELFGTDYFKPNTAEKDAIDKEIEELEKKKDKFNALTNALKHSSNFKLSDFYESLYEENEDGKIISKITGKIYENAKEVEHAIINGEESLDAAIERKIEESEDIEPEKEKIAELNQSLADFATLGVETYDNIVNTYIQGLRNQGFSEAAILELETTANRISAIKNTLLNEYGYDADTVNYRIEDYKQLNPGMTDEQAASLVLSLEAMHKVNNNYEEYAKGISEANKGTAEYYETLKELNKELGRYLGFDLPNNMEITTELLELMRKATLGDVEAWKKLTEIFSGDILNLKISNDFNKDFSGNGRTTDFEKQLNSKLQAAGINKRIKTELDFENIIVKGSEAARAIYAEMYYEENGHYPEWMEVKTDESPSHNKHYLIKSTYDIELEFNTLEVDEQKKAQVELQEAQLANERTTAELTHQNELYQSAIEDVNRSLDKLKEKYDSLDAAGQVQNIKEQIKYYKELAELNNNMGSILSQIIDANKTGAYINYQTAKKDFDEMPTFEGNLTSAAVKAEIDSKKYNEEEIGILNNLYLALLQQEGSALSLSLYSNNSDDALYQAALAMLQYVNIASSYTENGYRNGAFEKYNVNPENSEINRLEYLNQINAYDSELQGSGLQLSNKLKEMDNSIKEYDLSVSKLQKIEREKVDFYKNIEEAYQESGGLDATLLAIVDRLKGKDFGTEAFWTEYNKIINEYGDEYAEFANVIKDNAEKIAKEYEDAEKDVYEKRSKAIKNYYDALGLIIDGIENADWIEKQKLARADALIGLNDAKIKALGNSPQAAELQAENSEIYRNNIEIRKQGLEKKQTAKDEAFEKIKKLNGIEYDEIQRDENGNAKYIEEDGKQILQTEKKTFDINKYLNEKTGLIDWDAIEKNIADIPPELQKSLTNYDNATIGLIKDEADLETEFSKLNDSLIALSDLLKEDTTEQKKYKEEIKDIDNELKSMQLDDSDYQGEAYARQLEEEIPLLEKKLELERDILAEEEKKLEKEKVNIADGINSYLSDTDPNSGMQGLFNWDSSKDTKALLEELIAILEKIPTNKLTTQQSNLLELAKEYLANWNEIKQSIDDATQSVAEQEKKLEDMHQEQVKAMMTINDSGWHGLDRQITKIGKELKKILNISSRENLTGLAKINNLRQQEAAIRKQIAIYQKKLAMQKIELQRLIAIAQLEYGIQANAEGIVTNYAQIFASGNKNALQAVQVIESFGQQLQSTLDALDDLGESLLDKEAEIAKVAQEYALKEFKTTIELDIDTSEVERKIRRIKDKWEHAFDKNPIGKTLREAKLDLQDFVSYFEHDIPSYTNGINTMLGELATMQAGGTSSMYGTDQQAAIDDIKSYRDSLIGSLESMEESMQEVIDSYQEIIDKLKGKMDDVKGDYDTIDGLIQHDMNLLKRWYGEDSQTLAQWYGKQITNDMGMVAEMKSLADYWKLKMSEAVAGSDEWEKFKANYISALNDMNSATEKMIDDAKEKMLHAVKQVQKEVNQALIGDSDIGKAREDWEWKLKMSERYYDSVEETYEIETLQRKFEKSIKDTDRLQSQQKLKEVMEELLGILKKLAETNTVSEYDVQRATKIYELTLAQLALEEAQANKSLMRLRRDSQGNYKYEYVANDEDIIDKELALADKRHELYELEKEHMKNLLEEWISTLEEYLNKQMEILNDDTLSLEEKEARLLELKEKFAEKFKYLETEMAEAQANTVDTLCNYTGDTFDFTMEELKRMTSDTLDLLIGQMIPGYEEVITEAQADVAGLLEATTDRIIGELDMFETTFAYAMDLSRSSIEELSMGIDDNIGFVQGLIDTDKELVEGYKEEVEAIEDLIAELQGLKDAYEAVYQAAIDAINAALELRLIQLENAAMEAASSSTATGATAGGKTSNSSNGKNYVYGFIEDPKTHELYSVKMDSSKATLDSFIGGNKSVTSVNTGNKLIGDGQFFKDKNDYLEWKKYTEDTLGKKINTSFATGGYTGDWNSSEGKLAVLHEKELVLNKEDTSNILNAVELLRTMPDLIDSIRNDAFNQMSASVIAVAPAPMTNDTETQQLELNVQITATFPNVNTAQEIETALNDLINKASQRVFSTQR